MLLQGLFLILLLSLIGGFVAKALKTPSIVGYLLGGFVGSLILPKGVFVGDEVAEIGVALLMFSLGLEFSLSRLVKVGKVATFGAPLQVLVTSIIFFLILIPFFRFSPTSSLILGIAFSLSSTAVIVKLLGERGELGTIHGDIATSWSLVQDLMVIPIVAFLEPSSTLLSSIVLLILVFLITKLAVPYLIKISAAVGRELLLVFAVTLATGITFLAAKLGISPALGAFLAGVAIAGTQESHAIFAETRPIRDIFSVLFFVSLGYFADPQIIFSHLPTILVLVAILIFVKIIISFLVSFVFNYKGRTGVSVAFSLANAGEFAFVLLVMSKKLGIIDAEVVSIGTGVAILSLFVSPYLFKKAPFVFRKLRDATFGNSLGKKLFSQREENQKVVTPLTNHVIICGFGRMGKWIGKALFEIKIPFIVIDYNEKVVKEAKAVGIEVIYGDPARFEVLETAGIKNAKAIVLSMPDNMAQQEIIAYCQNKVPDIKIIARAHLDEDVRKLAGLKIRKVVQPEFEGALAIVKDILNERGYTRDQINEKMKSLRTSHTLHI